MRIQSALIGAVALAGSVAACSNAGGPGTAGRAVTFSLATRPVVPAASIAAAPEVFGSGNDTLVIDTVRLVLRKIELERVAGSGVCDSSSFEGHADDHADHCEEVKAGPLAIDLPLGAGASQQFTVALDTGTYDQLHVRIHELENKASDQALLATHPELAGASMMVTGSFNGTPFVYTNAISADMESALVPPVTVGASGTADLTLLVDISTWFSNGGTALVDPSTANAGGANEQLVRNNIRNSFKAFEDDNHNGEDDHDGHDNGGHGVDGSIVARR
ncbi:MAG: hypothetical protein ABJD11_06565 [Gemmatimonadota bacterium]